MKAAAGGHTEIVKYLIKKGADVDASDSQFESTALLYACMKVCLLCFLGIYLYVFFSFVFFLFLFHFSFSLSYKKSKFPDSFFFKGRNRCSTGISRRGRSRNEKDKQVNGV